jgi:hypothetical protein
MKAVKRAKVAGTKSKGIRKGKSLEAVKPLVKMQMPLVGPTVQPGFSTSSSGGTEPAESVSLNFSKIEFTYTPQKPE